MTRIEDHFIGAVDGMQGVPTDWDPLRESDALQEAALLDCRVCPLTGRAGLLLDMRTALQYRTGNAALLVVRGLRSFSWRETPPEVELFNFPVGSSSPSMTKGAWRIDLGLFLDGELSVEGRAADFRLLEVRGVPEMLPDYSGRRLDQVRHALPWWDAECTVLEWSSTDSG
ncbi:hypothetical protein ACIBUY_02900 [Streptomyces sp. NPDC050085]|uniref:hypothetical protein n=1 Tax=Streptomyces sp. NPDC050085 TaxID=3365600 RepID=UPI0037A9D6FA